MTLQTQEQAKWIVQAVGTPRKSEASASLNRIYPATLVADGLIANVEIEILFEDLEWVKKQAAKRSAQLDEPNAIKNFVEWFLGQRLKGNGSWDPVSTSRLLMSRDAVSYWWS
jgi:hypothetical protein